MDFPNNKELIGHRCLFQVFFDFHPCLGKWVETINGRFSGKCGTIVASEVTEQAMPCKPLKYIRLKNP